MMRGQLALEFLVILAVMLLLFNVVSMDLMNTSVSDALSLQMAETVSSVKSVLNATAEAFAFQGSGAKKTLYLRAPPDCNVVADPAQVTLSCVSTSSFYATYDGMKVSPTGAFSYACPSCSDGKTVKAGRAESVTITKP